MILRIVVICAALLPSLIFGQTVYPDSADVVLPADTLQPASVEKVPGEQHAADSTESGIFFTNPAVESEETIVAKEAKLLKPHSPRKATIYSAVLPGLGQAYNRKYWKIPIVYAGLGVGVYFLQDNIRQANYFMDNYRNATDDDPSTINDSGYNPNTLQDLVIQHRKWRDYSYLGILAVYLLNIIDAQVDAHLFHFDVSKDLSMQVVPSIMMTAQPTPGLTLCLKL